MQAPIPRRIFVLHAAVFVPSSCTNTAARAAATTTTTTTTTAAIATTAAAAAVLSSIRTGGGCFERAVHVQLLAIQHLKGR